MIKKLRVTVDGKAFDVSAEVPDEPVAKPAPAPTQSVAAAPVSAPVSATPAAPSAPKAGEVVSPLSGRVITINVKVGQEVKAEEHVLTLEAMKMNTFVFVPSPGRVKEIRTEVGAAVQEGQVLLVIE
jgi:biotin carboxyl carrier protein